MSSSDPMAAFNAQYSWPATEPAPSRQNNLSLAAKDGLRAQTASPAPGMIPNLQHLQAAGLASGSVTPLDPALASAGLGVGVGNVGKVGNVRNLSGVGVGGVGMGGVGVGNSNLSMAMNGSIPNIDLDQAHMEFDDEMDLPSTTDTGMSAPASAQPGSIPLSAQHSATTLSSQHPNQSSAGLSQHLQVPDSAHLVHNMQNAGASGSGGSGSQEGDGDSTKNPQPFSRSPELRISHKIAERKRRKEMKDLFDELRDMLPSERGSKASKWEILNKAVEHIQRLRVEADQASAEVKRLEHDLEIARGAAYAYNTAAAAGFLAGASGQNGGLGGVGGMQSSGNDANSGNESGDVGAGGVENDLNVVGPDFGTKQESGSGSLSGVGVAGGAGRSLG